MTNQQIIKVLEDYKKYHKKLCKAFVKKYFSYDDGSISDHFVIGESLDGYSPGPISIDDQYFYTAGEMREALYNNFDEKLVKDRNEEQHDVQINFYNFCKYNKMQGRYTTKEIAESEQKVKKTEKEFKKLLSRYNQKD